MTTEGLGKVLIQRKDGNPSSIFDVLFVPGMKSNLLSLGQLLEKGYMMEMKEKFLKVHDRNERPILKAPLAKNRTFQVLLKIMEHQCLASSVSKDEWLWHYRFGHLNFNDLCLLHRQDMVRGLPRIQLPKELCEDCLESKLPRNSFKQQVHS